MAAQAEREMRTRKYLDDGRAEKGQGSTVRALQIGLSDKCDMIIIPKKATMHDLILWRLVLAAAVAGAIIVGVILVDHHEEFEPDYTLMNWIAIGLCSVLPTLFFNWR